MSYCSLATRSLFLRLLEKVFLIGAMVIAFSPVCYGFHWKNIEIVPSLTSETEYNDNIYYAKWGTEADVINRVIPGLTILFPVPSTQWDLELAYTPIFEFFSENEDLNDVAHEATGRVRIQPQENIIFTCEDSFFRGKDFGEIDVLGLRRMREKFWSNTVTPSLEYTFGPNRVLSLEYINAMIDYDNPSLADSREDTVNPMLTYGMGRNIVTLDYKYTYGAFQTDFQNLDGHAVTLEYEYLLNPRTSILSEGRFLYRDFNLGDFDYKIYYFLLGFRMDLLANLSIEARGGYLRYQPEPLDEEYEDSFIGMLTATYELERLTFNFTADMGYDELYTAIEILGYASAWGVKGSFAYNLHRFWSVELTGEYRERDFMFYDRDDYFWTAGWALIFEPVAWFSATVSYEHAALNSSVDIDDYDVNRGMLVLEFSY